MNKVYQFITFMSLILLPVAPAGFMFFDVYHDMIGLGSTAVIGVFIALSTAVGFESMGIKSGHNIAQFWQVGDSSGISISLIGILFYWGLGCYATLGTSGPIFITAATVNYIVVALSSVASDKRLDQRESAKIKAESYQVIELHKLKLDNQRLTKRDERKHQLALAKVNQQPQVAETLLQVDKKVSATKRKPGETKRLIAEMLTKEPSLKNSEIAKRLKVSRQAVGNHKRSMAGELGIDKADLGGKLQEMSKSNGKVLNGVHS